MHCPHSDCRVGFVSKFKNLFGAILEDFQVVQDPGRGAKPVLPAWELLASLVYHVFAGAGCLSAHVFQLFDMNIADSSLSQRRQRMGIEPFEWLMSHALRPLADGRSHKSCFYKGLRLCGIDGSRRLVDELIDTAVSALRPFGRRAELLCSLGEFVRGRDR